MIKNNNYITIQGWMVKELDLSGNDLLVYAIIFGFSQEDNSWFDGSLSYLCSFINCKSKNTIIKSLNSLIEKKLIIKQENYVNNVKFCKYRTVYQNLIWGISKNDTNNKYILKENNISKDILSKKSFKKPTINEIKEYCSERNNSVDAENFFNYYESIGWKVGKNPMKDWKAAVRTWEKNNNNNNQNNKPQSNNLIKVDEGAFQLI